MSEFCLYAIDHAALEALVLRVLKAIGENDRKEWAGFIKELRDSPCPRLSISSVGRIGGGCGGARPNLTDPLEDERMTARKIPPWDDARLVLALRELAQLSARHRFSGGLGKVQPWLVDLPLTEPFASDGERAEFTALDTLVLRSGRPWPRHLEFLRDPDARSSYLTPEEVAGLGQLMEDNGYLKRAAQGLGTSLEDPTRRFLARLRAFVMLAGAEGCSLYYRELYT